MLPVWPVPGLIVQYSDPTASMRPRTPFRPDYSVLHASTAPPEVACPWRTTWTSGLTPRPRTCSRTGRTRCSPLYKVKGGFKACKRLFSLDFSAKSVWVKASINPKNQTVNWDSQKLAFVMYFKLFHQPIAHKRHMRPVGSKQAIN